MLNRLPDTMFCFVGLVFLFALFMLVSLLAKLESKGLVFYRRGGRMLVDLGSLSRDEMFDTSKRFWHSGLSIDAR